MCSPNVNVRYVIGDVRFQSMKEGLNLTSHTSHPYAKFNFISEIAAF